MRRRNFLALGGGAALGLMHRANAMPVPFQDEKSKLKITGVRLVHTRPKRPVPAYQPAAGSWSTGGVEVANPMSIYPEYKAQRSLFMPDPGKLEGFTVEISTDKGVKGYGSGGIAGGAGGDGAFHQAADRRRPVQHRADLGHSVSLQHVLRAGRRGAATPSAAWTWRSGI